MNTSHPQFLELIALAGEVQKNQLERIYSQQYVRKAINKYKSQQLIIGSNEKGVYAYRLSAAGRLYLEKRFPERFPSGIPGVRSTVDNFQTRNRFLIHCSTYITMQNAGVPIFADEKSRLYEGVPPDELIIPAYYSSVEMKRNTTKELLKIQGARFCGLLLTPRWLYVVFNICDKPYPFKVHGEDSVKGVIQKDYCGEVLGSRYGYRSIKAMLLMDKLSSSLYYLNRADPNKTEYYCLERIYEYGFHCIPNDVNGEELVRKMSGIGFGPLPESYLRQHGLTPPMDYYGPPHDAFKNGKAVLCTFDFDLHRIAKFRRFHVSERKEGIIFCYKHQEPVLREYFGSRVSFEVFSDPSLAEATHTYEENEL